MCLCVYTVCVCVCVLNPQAIAVRDMAVKGTTGFLLCDGHLGMWPPISPPWTHTHTHVYTHTAPLADAPGLLWSWWQMELAVITSSLTSACSVIPCNAQILLCVVCVCMYVCACVCTKDCPSSYHTLFHSTSWKWDGEEIINNAEEEINFSV